MPAYRVDIVNRADSSLIRTLANANVESLVEEINQPDECVFTFPKHDPASAAGQGADVQLLTRDVQVWREGATKPSFWGTLLTGNASSKSGDVKVRARDFGWHFMKRAIQKARQQFITNADFETGAIGAVPTGWTANGCTAEIVASPRRLGAQAVKLVNATTNADAHLAATSFSHTAGPRGDLLTIVYHVQITAWTGPALDARGLYVEGRQGAVVRDKRFVPLDDADGQELNKWKRLQVEMWIPNNETWDIFPRLYAPNATVIYDAGQGVFPESLGLFGGDIATLANMVVEFITNPANGFDNLGGLGRSTPATGITIPEKFWQYADYTYADRALEELVTRGLDWSVVLGAGVAPATATKTFTTFAPRQGVDRSATVTLQVGTNMASYDYEEDGTATENDIVAYSTEDGADGPDREEGRAKDTAPLGGLVLQGIYPAPVGMAIDGLKPMADEKLARTKRLVKLPQPVTIQKAGDLVGLLGKGDIIKVLINDGWVQVPSANYRIVRKEHRPRNDTLLLTLNQE